MLFAVALAVLLTGCGQNASTVSTGTARDIINNVRYARDEKTGLCYAVVASRKDFHFSQNGFTITYVPCTPEVEKQIGK